MKLTFYPLPPILKNESVSEWRKFQAFWNLPLDMKADVVDDYPDLIIERIPPKDQADAGVSTSIFFNYDVLTEIDAPYLLSKWSVISIADEYPKQLLPHNDDYQSWMRLRKLNEEFDSWKFFMMISLEPLNFAALAYKYRQTVKPELFFFPMDYEQALCDASTTEELMSFYDPT